MEPVTSSLPLPESCVRCSVVKEAIGDPANWVLLLEKSIHNEDAQQFVQVLKAIVKNKIFFCYDGRSDQDSVIGKCPHQNPESPAYPDAPELEFLVGGDIKLSARTHAEFMLSQALPALKDAIEVFDLSNPEDTQRFRLSAVHQQFMDDMGVKYCVVNDGFPRLLRSAVNNNDKENFITLLEVAKRGNYTFAFLRDEKAASYVWADKTIFLHKDTCDRIVAAVTRKESWIKKAMIEVRQRSLVTPPVAMDNLDALINS